MGGRGLGFPGQRDLTRREGGAGDRGRSRPPSMSLICALGVIGQDLDDAALSDTAMRALVEHPLHLRPEGGEPRDLAVDGSVLDGGGKSEPVRV